MFLTFKFRVVPGDTYGDKDRVSLRSLLSSCLKSNPCPNLGDRIKFLRSFVEKNYHYLNLVVVGIELSSRLSRGIKGVVIKKFHDITRHLSFYHHS